VADLRQTGPYDIGDKVTMEGSFYVWNPATETYEPGAPALPVTCKVTKPDGSHVTPDPPVTQDGAVFTATTKPDQSGDWWWRMFDAAGEVAEERMFYVRPQRA
jgi:hypothetical protein